VFTFNNTQALSNTQNCLKNLILDWGPAAPSLALASGVASAAELMGIAILGGPALLKAAIVTALGNAALHATVGGAFYLGSGAPCRAERHSGDGFQSCAMLLSSTATAGCAAPLGERLARSIFQTPLYAGPYGVLAGRGILSLLLIWGGPATILACGTGVFHKR
jgi:hypothetical protein